MFEQEEFNEFIVENGVVGFKEKDITLKSGRKSRWYANCRRLTDTAALTNKLADFVIKFLGEKGVKADYVYGVPAGATKLAIAINLKIGKDTPLVIGREKPKEHGDAKDKYFVGPVAKGDKVVVVEDVTTTGGSLITALERLKEAGIDIVATIGLVNRMEKRDDGLTVAEKIKELGAEHHSMSNAFALLPREFARNKPSEETKKHVEEYFDKYSIRTLKLG